MTQPDDLAVAHNAASQGEAELIRTILEGAGVFAIIPDRNVPYPGVDLTPLDGTYSPSGCAVLVSVRDLELARSVIREARSVGELPQEEAAPEGESLAEGESE